MARFTKSAALVLCAAVLIATAQENRSFESSVKKRNALANANAIAIAPLYRDAVDELMGGKTPESLMNRLELNEIDAMGMMAPGAESKATQLKDMQLDEQVQTRALPHRGYPHTFPHQGLYNSPPPHMPPHNPHHAGGYHGHMPKPSHLGGYHGHMPHMPKPSHYPSYAAAPAYYAGAPAHSSYHHPGPYAPPHPAPGYHEPEPYHPQPTPAYHKPEPYHPPTPAYGHPEPAYGHPEPAYGHPEPAYGHPEPAYGHPEPAYGHPKPDYGHPEPGYGPPKPYAPKEPVLLAKRPHQVKEILPVEIVTHDTYTNFDCRGKNYETIYADVEAECKIYHVCHSHGKQDTFHCPYGTTFNEYIGTCDHSGAVVCHSGPGYAKPDPPHKKPGYQPPHPGYHEPAPYHPPAPHPHHASPHHAAPHHAAPHHAAPHHAAPYHPSPAPYHPTPAYHPPTPAPYHSPTPAPYHSPTPAPYHSPAPYAPSPYPPHGREYDAPFVHF